MTFDKSRTVPQRLIDNTPVYQIRTIADFPKQPINGILYLYADTSYRIVGALDLLGLRLVCLGKVGIVGDTSETSSVASTGLGAGVPLITATAGEDLTIRNLSVFNISSGVVFSISGGGTAQINFTAFNVFNCNIGTISNVGNAIFLNCAIINSYGLIFNTAVSTISFSQTNMSVPVGQTLITLAATLVVSRRFRILNSPISVPVGAVGISFVAGVSIPTDMVVFTDVGFSGGSANYVLGLTANDLRSRWTENRGIDNSANSGYYSMENNNTPTIIASANTFTKIAGTTTAGTLQRFTHSNNRLTYTGVLVRSFGVHVAASVEGSANNTIQVRIQRYNSANVLQEVSASTRSTISGNNRAENIGVLLAVTMQPNDYVEIWVANSTSQNVTATELIVMVR